MLVNIANAQARLGADIHVIIINDMYKEELMRRFDESINIHLIHRKYQSRNICFIFKLNRLLMKLNPDAIHMHSSRIITFFWRKRLSHVASVTLHDLPTGSLRHGGLTGRLFPFLYKSGNVYHIDRIPRVFAISEAVKDGLWQHYGIESKVVCNGIMTHNFKIRPERKPCSTYKIIMVSRLEHEKKGQDLLIEAASMLKGKVRVDFIGDGSSKQFLEKLIAEKGMQEYIRLLGSKSQSYITEHLCDYDLFVQPSRWEGFGLTVAEAMASHLPVLVSAGQGPAEVTCGEIYGWTFENGNSDDLAVKIKYIIEHYNEAMEKAKISLNYVRNQYDVAMTARKYLDLYKTEQTTGGVICHEVVILSHANLRRAAA